MLKITTVLIGFVFLKLSQHRLDTSIKKLRSERVCNMVTISVMRA